MNSTEFVQSIENTYKTAVEIVKAKNHDYAGTTDPFKNFKNSEFFNIPVEKGILVRLGDKMARISNLLDSEAQVKDEKITDSIVDALNYLAILKAWLEAKK